MPSYQDITQRLAIVEDKLDFVMRAFTLRAMMKSPIEGAPPTMVEKTMIEAYREIKHAGLVITDRPDQPIGDANVEMVGADG